MKKRLEEGNEVFLANCRQACQTEGSLRLSLNMTLIVLPYWCLETGLTHNYERCGGGGAANRSGKFTLPEDY
jgi:hypothetical protein